MPRPLKKKASSNPQKAEAKTDLTDTELLEILSDLQERLKVVQSKLVSVTFSITMRDNPKDDIPF